MYLISSRESFWSDTELSVHDAIKEVDLVGDRPSRDVDDHEAFLSDLSGKKILVLVHGYNNEPEDVHNAYAIIENRIASSVANENAYHQIIGYIWPGGDDPLDYFSAKGRANALARRFGIWLQRMSDNEITVDVMGHSMGPRVILKALKTRPAQVVRNVFMMAAAVDNESIEMDEEFYPSTKRSKNVFVFHSKHDPVLKTAYRIAEFDNALGLRGPEDPHDIIAHSAPTDPATPNVFVVNCKHHIHKHGAYKRTAVIYDYISSFLTGTVPDQYVTLPR